MAETFGFFDAEELTDGTFDREYIAEQWANYFKLFVGNGVFATPTNQLKVVAYTGMFVKISIGWAFINGYWYHNDTELEVEIPANMTASTITDGIFIRWDSANREIKAVVGVDRTTPNRVAPYYELKLADIVVSTGATQITDAEITDTRMDSSVCGIVTGVIDVIDAGNLFAQYQAIFTQWMNSTDTDFDEWRDNQEALYTQWYNAIKAQQTQDLEDFDAWFEAIKGQLSEDAAGHLQNEIDDIIAQGLSGSIFTITTTQTELYGKDVTITGPNVAKTGKFNNQGVAVITGFTDVGTITITSTDNLETATTVMSIPYFGRYTATLAFWSATVNLEGNESLYGSTITVKNSDNLTVGTVVLSVLDGTGVFTATAADTYTFITTLEGETYTWELEVSQETTYNLELSVGFKWENWLTAGNVDPTDYASLSDVFADEATVRKLMLVHASADYLIEKVTDDTDVIDDFVANDTAMKWIGLCDYVCDGLTAITGVETKFLASQYLERYLKDHVPVMTSNTAPYGTITWSSINNSYPAYRAFDGDNATEYAAANTVSTNVWLAYKFASPICVKRFHLIPNKPTDTADCRVKNFRIEASNDGFDTKEVLYTGIYDAFSADGMTANIDNDNYFLEYRIFVIDIYKSSTQVGIITLQFYGRSLDVSVPTMTSSVLPYGECIISEQYSTYPAYQAFDGNSNTLGTFKNVAGETGYIGYHFPNKCRIKQVYFLKQYVDTSTFVVQGSNDGFVSDIHDLTESFTIDSSSATIVNLTKNIGDYAYYRIYANLASSGVSNGTAWYTINFFGVDYSEKEFEAGTTKKWLYDHGVELETATSKLVGANTVANKNDDNLYVEVPASTSRFAGFILPSVDLSPFSLLRAVTGDEVYVNATSARMSLRISVESSPNPSYNTTPLAYYSCLGSSSENLPNNLSVNINSINQLAYPAVLTFNASDTAMIRKGTIKELWLE